MAGVIFGFGGYELDTDQVELRAEGEEQAIEPQVYDVLVYLLENRDRVVTKEELLDNIWVELLHEERQLLFMFFTIAMRILIGLIFGLGSLALGRA